MEFAILGPLQVLRDGAMVALGGAKPRALLAMLLVHANEPVSAERLAVGLWGEDAAAREVRALQVHVSRLRKALGDADRLTTTPAGYRLRVTPGELDAERFESLVADGRRALASGRPLDAGTHLREALQLWQGEALADVAFEPFAHAEAARLEEQRLEAVELRVEADLLAGRHAELVGELQRLVSEHPLRERLHHQLMLALYRAGRQADALDTYRRARQVLIEQVGLEPGHELRALEHAVLSQDPGLLLPMAGDRSETLAPVGPTPLPPPMARRVRFVGRADELAGLRRTWDKVVDGERQVVLLAGEPGIGKTSLAAQFAGEVHGSGAPVLYGRCDADPAAPYQPFVEAVRVFADHRLADAERTPEASRRADLISAITPADPPHRLRSESADAARYRFFEDATSALDAVAGAHALLFVLDDLHWADRPTLLLLRHVVRHGAAPMMIVGTYRNLELSRGHLLGDLLVDLRRERVLEQFVLAGLDERETEKLMSARAVAYGEPTLVRWVQAQTAGNPFFIEEVLRELPEIFGEPRGAAPIEPVLDRFPVPEGAKQLIASRLSRLNPRTEEVLGLGATIGVEFELMLLEELGEPRDSLVPALEEAVAAGLITEVPGRAGRFAFAHALVRETVYQGQTATRRALTHLRIAEVLERAESGSTADVAHHFTEARQLASPVKVRDSLVRAARDASTALAFETAAGHLRRALELASPTDARSEVELLLALADAQQRAGEREPAQDALRRAVTLARQLGDADALGRAALGYGGGFPWYGFSYRTDPALTALLEEALTAQEEHGDAGLRVRLLARLALERYYATRYAEASTLSTEAVTCAGDLPDPEARLLAQYSALFPLDGPDDVVRLEEAAGRIVALACREGDAELAFRARVFRLRARLQLADSTGADRDIVACTRAAEQLQQPLYRWQASVLRAMRALMRGSLSGGERESQAAYAMGVEAGQADEARYVYVPQALIVAWMRGGLLDFEAPLRAYLESAPTMAPRIEATISWILAEGGRRDEAQKYLARCMDRDPAQLPRHSLWLLMVAQLAEASAMVAQPAFAERLLPLLRPYADRCLITGAGAAYAGAVTYFLGCLTAVLRRWDESEHWFQMAVSTEDRMDARPYQVRAQLAWAGMLRARNADGDRERAVALATTAGSTAADLGLAALSARARSVAEDEQPASGAPVGPS